MSERRERIRASLRASQDATRERMARRRERLSRKADRETQARLAEVKRAKTLEERVCRDLPPWAPSDTCWEWQGFRDEDGYGRFQWQGKKIRAHRAAYIRLAATRGTWRSEHRPTTCETVKSGGAGCVLRTGVDREWTGVPNDGESGKYHDLQARGIAWVFAARFFTLEAATGLEAVTRRANPPESLGFGRRKRTGKGPGGPRVLHGGPTRPQRRSLLMPRKPEPGASPWVWSNYRRLRAEQKRRARARKRAELGNQPLTQVGTPGAPEPSRSSQDLGHSPQGPPDSEASPEGRP